MSEPVTTSVIASNVIANTAATGIIIFGIHTGLEYPTMIAALGGAALALSYFDYAPGWKRALQVLGAALFAGYAAPVLTGIIIYQLIRWGFIDANVSTQGAELFVAVLIAFLAHGVMLPGIQAFAKKRSKKLTQGEN